MSGPPKKAQGRQRTNTPEVGLVAVPTDGVAIPERPKSWLKATVTQWDAWWASPMAALIDVASEGAIVLRMFDLLDQAERLEREGRKATLVKGSTGQPSINPLLKHAQALREEARKDEAVLGRGPRRRLDLGVKFGEAARSIDDANRRLATHAVEAPPDDPRLQAIEA